MNVMNGPTDTERLNLLIELRRYAEAEKAAREAIGRDPQWGEGYTHLARALSCLNRKKEAIAAAREGIRHSSKDPWAFCILASTLNCFNLTEAALDAAEEYVRLDPTYAWGYAVLANILYCMKRFKSARRTALVGLKYEPDNENLLRWKGWAEFSLERFRDARETAEAALTLEPNSHQMLNLLGSLKWSQAERRTTGKRLALHREADRIFLDAVRLVPTESAYRDNQRDNAISARRYLLSYLVVIAAFVLVVIPSFLFAELTNHQPRVEKPFLPASIAFCYLGLVYLIPMPLSCVLIVPLDWCKMPRVGLSRRERIVGRAELAAYAIFGLAPYGAMAVLLARAYFP